MAREEAKEGVRAIGRPKVKGGRKHDIWQG